MGGTHAPVRFDAPFTFVAPALAGRPTAPVVRRVEWYWGGIGDDELEPVCVVRDDDGEPLTVTLALETETCRAAGNCWTSLEQLPGCAFSIDVKVQQMFGQIEFGRRIQGEIACSVTDAGGRFTRATLPICIDGPSSGTCR